MKKQTAVEWLVKIYLQTNKIDSFDIEQAKEMEKQQIKEAYYVGYEHAEHGVHPQGDDYYHKLY